MAGFDDKVVVMGEWLVNGPNHKKRSKPELDDIEKNNEFSQTSFQEKPSYSGGGLGERIAARAGFSVPMIKTENIIESTCLTISSPGVSPATLLESPVFLSNPLPSPTTGKLSSLPSDEAKDELFDNFATSLAFQSFPTSTNICLEPDDSQDYEQKQLGGLEETMPSSAPADDGYNWRKYGQKQVKGSEYPRSYYKCTHPNCQVRKKVERSREGHITEIIYAKTHNHPKPLPNRRSSIGSSSTCHGMQIDENEQTEKEWTSPISTELEYGSYSGSMQVQSNNQFGYGDALFKDEEDRTSHMSVSLAYDEEVDESDSKRRKVEAYEPEVGGASRTTREPKVVVQTKSDIDILEDGYRWRKYGQKVVKGNPNPRSYYKCTANGCTVTKHVEKASDDLTSVLTTYIGIHTHEAPAARNSSHVSSVNLQGGLATQSHNYHVHYPVSHSIAEGLITGESSLFDFQAHLGTPLGYSVYIDQAEFFDYSLPSLAIGQEQLPSLQAPAISDPAGVMFQLAPESESQQGLELSSIYRDIMSRLPHI